MSKPSASTYLRDGAEVFTMEIDKAPPKWIWFNFQQKTPTNTSGRMFAALRGTPEVLAALEKRTRTAGGDVVCIMRDDGTAIYAGQGEIDSVDENPAVVENKTTTMTRLDDGTVAKSVTMNAREETRHSAQLAWAGRSWSEEIIMLNALPDECRADIDASSVGEAVRGWDATEVAAGQLALLKTPLERAERNSLLAVDYAVAQIMGAQFAHRRTSERATTRAQESKRIPLEARQVNALTIRHRDANTRARLIKDRGLKVSTKVDASSRTRIIIALVSGTSRGKVAQLQLFATEGYEGDIGLLALEEMARNRDQAQARRMLALITILTEKRGGIRWNEEGKRWLRLQAMALMGQPAATASKAQSDLMRAEIERLGTEALLVSPYGRKRSKRSKGETERISILTATHTSGETGEVTRIALNPALAESMMGKGRGVWMPREVFAISDNDGGYAFTLAFTLIIRWQLGGAKGWESFEKTMEAAGTIGAFKQRAETQGVRDAREWLEGLLVQLRPMMGVVEIDWARGRFIFAQRPKWLTFKRSALLLESDSDNVRLGAASDPA